MIRGHDRLLFVSLPSRPMCLTLWTILLFMIDVIWSIHLDIFIAHNIDLVQWGPRHAHMCRNWHITHFHWSRVWHIGRFNVSNQMVWQSENIWIGHMKGYGLGIWKDMDWTYERIWIGHRRIPRRSEAICWDSWIPNTMLSTLIHTHPLLTTQHYHEL